MELRTSDGRPVYVEQPDIVRTRRGLTLIGHPTLVWPAAVIRLDEDFLGELLFPAVRSAGVIMDSLGVVQAFVPMPPGFAAIEQPRALPGAHQRAHVFWGSWDGGSGSSRTPVTGFWYAQYDGERWTTPERVLRALRIFSGRTTVSVLERLGILHVAAFVADRSDSTGYREGIQYARRAADGTWSSEWIELGPHDGGVRHIALVPLPAPDHLLIAFTGSVVTDRLEVGPHGLYAATTLDAGLSWGLPQLVRPLDTSSGYLLDAVQAPSGESVLVWVSRIPTSDGSGAVRQRAHFATTKDGRTWADLPDLELPDSVDGRLPLAATTGGVSLLGSGPTADHMYLWHRSLPAAESGPWPIPSVLRLHKPAMVPTLSTPSSGELFAAWLSANSLSAPGRGSTIVPASLVARFTSCATASN